MLLHHQLSPPLRKPTFGSSREGALLVGQSWDSATTATRSASALRYVNPGPGQYSPEAALRPRTGEQMRSVSDPATHALLNPPGHSLRPAARDLAVLTFAARRRKKAEMG